MTSKFRAITNCFVKKYKKVPKEGIEPTPYLSSNLLSHHPNHKATPVLSLVITPLSHAYIQFRLIV